MDLGKYEALLPNRERVPTEEYQVGERIRCYVKAVEEGPHGPEIILSRADPAVRHQAVPARSVRDQRRHH